MFRPEGEKNGGGYWYDGLPGCEHTPTPEIAAEALRLWVEKGWADWNEAFWRLEMAPERETEEEC